MLVIFMDIWKFTGRYLLGVLLFNLAACSSMQTVSVERAMQHSPPPGVTYGSLVKVLRFNGEKHEFRVTDISPEGLGGTQGFHRFEDMRSLRVERTGDGRGFGWVVGALGIAALIALIANADSVNACSPGPCPVGQP